MMRSRDVLARACFLRGRQASLAETDEFVEQVQELRARVGELEAAVRRVTQERDHFKALIDGVVAARKAHEEALDWPQSGSGTPSAFARGKSRMPNAPSARPASCCNRQ
jgi:hypothetical protein